MLLIENDPETCASLVETLGAHYQVEATSDGLAGWNAAQQRPPALVVIGLSISAQDCLIFTRALREDRRTATPPIILLTASTDRELLLACLAAGATNFLLKPFPPKDLLACVRLELKLHGARRRRTKNACGVQ